MNLISAVMVPLIMLGGIFFLISSMFGGGPRFGRGGGITIGGFLVIILVIAALASPMLKMVSTLLTWVIRIGLIGLVVVGAIWLIRFLTRR